MADANSVSTASVMSTSSGSSGLRSKGNNRPRLIRMKDQPSRERVTAAIAMVRSRQVVTPTRDQLMAATTMAERSLNATPTPETRSNQETTTTASPARTPLTPKESPFRQSPSVSEQTHMQVPSLTSMPDTKQSKPSSPASFFFNVFGRRGTTSAASNSPVVTATNQENERTTTQVPSPSTPPPPPPMPRPPPLVIPPPPASVASHASEPQPSSPDAPARARRLANIRARVLARREAGNQIPGSTAGSTTSLPKPTPEGGHLAAIRSPRAGEGMKKYLEHWNHQKTTELSSADKYPVLMDQEISKDDDDHDDDDYSDSSSSISYSSSEDGPNVDPATLANVTRFIDALNQHKRPPSLGVVNAGTGLPLLATMSSESGTSLPETAVLDPTVLQGLGNLIDKLQLKQQQQQQQPQQTETSRETTVTEELLTTTKIAATEEALQSESTATEEAVQPETTATEEAVQPETTATETATLQKPSYSEAFEQLLLPDSSTESHLAGPSSSESDDLLRIVDYDELPYQQMYSKTFTDSTLGEVQPETLANIAAYIDSVASNRPKFLSKEAVEMVGDDDDDDDIDSPFVVDNRAVIEECPSPPKTSAPTSPRLLDDENEENEQRGNFDLRVLSNESKTTTGALETRDELMEQPSTSTTDEHLQEQMSEMEYLSEVGIEVERSASEVETIETSEIPLEVEDFKVQSEVEQIWKVQSTSDVEHISQAASEVEHISRAASEVEQISRAASEVEQVVQPASEIEQVVQPASEIEQVVQPASEIEQVVQPASEIEQVVQPASDVEQLWNVQPTDVEHVLRLASQALLEVEKTLEAEEVGQSSSFGIYFEGISAFEPTIESETTLETGTSSEDEQTSEVVTSSEELDSFYQDGPQYEQLSDDSECLAQPSHINEATLTPCTAANPCEDPVEVSVAAAGLDNFADVSKSEPALLVERVVEVSHEKELKPALSIAERQEDATGTFVDRLNLMGRETPLKDNRTASTANFLPFKNDIRESLSNDSHDSSQVNRDFGESNNSLHLFEHDAHEEFAASASAKVDEVTTPMSEPLVLTNITDMKELGPSFASPLAIPKSSGIAEQIIGAYIDSLIAGVPKVATPAKEAEPTTWFTTSLPKDSEIETLVSESKQLVSSLYQYEEHFQTDFEATAKMLPAVSDDESSESKDEFECVALEQELMSRPSVEIQSSEDMNSTGSYDPIAEARSESIRVEESFSAQPDNDDVVSVENDDVVSVENDGRAPTSIVTNNQIECSRITDGHSFAVAVGSKDSDDEVYPGQIVSDHDSTISVVGQDDESDGEHHPAVSGRAFQVEDAAASAEHFQVADAGESFERAFGFQDEFNCEYHGLKTSDVTKPPKESEEQLLSNVEVNSIDSDELLAVLAIQSSSIEGVFRASPYSDDTETEDEKKDDSVVEDDEDESIESVKYVQVDSFDSTKLLPTPDQMLSHPWTASPFITYFDQSDVVNKAPSETTKESRDVLCFDSKTSEQKKGPEVEDSSALPRDLEVDFKEDKSAEQKKEPEVDDACAPPLNVEEEDKLTTTPYEQPGESSEMLCVDDNTEQGPEEKSKITDFRLSTGVGFGTMHGDLFTDAPSMQVDQSGDVLCMDCNTKQDREFDESSNARDCRLISSDVVKQNDGLAVTPSEQNGESGEELFAENGNEQEKEPLTDVEQVSEQNEVLSDTRSMRMGQSGDVPCVFNTTEQHSDSYTSCNEEGSLLSPDVELDCELHDRLSDAPIEQSDEFRNKPFADLMTKQEGGLDERCEEGCSRSSSPAIELDVKHNGIVTDAPSSQPSHPYDVSSTEDKGTEQESTLDESCNERGFLLLSAEVELDCEPNGGMNDERSEHPGESEEKPCTERKTEEGGPNECKLESSCSVSPDVELDVVANTLSSQSNHPGGVSSIEGTEQERTPTVSCNEEGSLLLSPDVELDCELHDRLSDAPSEQSDEFRNKPFADLMTKQEGGLDERCEEGCSRSSSPAIELDVKHNGIVTDAPSSQPSHPYEVSSTEDKGTEQERTLDESCKGESDECKLEGFRSVSSDVELAFTPREWDEMLMPDVSDERDAVVPNLSSSDSRTSNTSSPSRSRLLGEDLFKSSASASLDQQEQNLPNEQIEKCDSSYVPIEAATDESNPWVVRSNENSNDSVASHLQTQESSTGGGEGRSTDVEEASSRDSFEGKSSSNSLEFFSEGEENTSLLVSKEESNDTMESFDSFGAPLMNSKPPLRKQIPTVTGLTHDLRLVGTFAFNPPLTISSELAEEPREISSNDLESIARESERLDFLVHSLLQGPDSSEESSKLFTDSSNFSSADELVEHVHLGSDSSKGAGPCYNYDDNCQEISRDAFAGDGATHSLAGNAEETLATLDAVALSSCVALDFPEASSATVEELVVVSPASDTEIALHSNVFEAADVAVESMKLTDQLLQDEIDAKAELGQSTSLTDGYQQSTDSSDGTTARDQESSQVDTEEMSISYTDGNENYVEDTAASETELSIEKSSRDTESRVFDSTSQHVTTISRDIENIASPEGASDEEIERLDESAAVASALLHGSQPTINDDTQIHEASQRTGLPYHFVDQIRLPAAEKNQELEQRAVSSSIDDPTSEDTNEIDYISKVNKDESSTFSSRFASFKADGRFLSIDTGALGSFEGPSYEERLQSHADARSSQHVAALSALLDNLCSPEGASDEEIEHLNEFTKVAAPILSGSRPTTIEEALIRQASQRAGLPIHFVDQILDLAVGRNQELNQAESSSTADGSTPKHMKKMFDEISDVDDNENIAAFFRRFAALKAGGHFPDANIEALGSFGKVSNDGDGVEVDVIRGYVRKEFEQSQVTLVQPTTVGEVLDHSVSRNVDLVQNASSSSVSGNTTTPIYGELSDDIAEVDENDNISAFFRRFAALEAGGHFPDANVQALGSFGKASNDGDGVEVDVVRGYVRKEFAQSLPDPKDSLDDVLENISELHDQPVAVEGSSGGTPQLTGTEKAMSSLLDRLVSPEGASDVEVEHLNEFVKLAASIWKGSQSTAVEEALIRQASQRAGIPIHFVDQVLELAAGREDLLQAGSSSTGGGSTPKHMKKMFDDISEVDENENISAFFRRFAAFEAGGHFPDANIEALGSFGRVNSDGDGVEVDIVRGFVKKEFEQSHVNEERTVRCTDSVEEHDIQSAAAERVLSRQSSERTAIPPNVVDKLIDRALERSSVMSGSNSGGRYTPKHEKGLYDEISEVDENENISAFFHRLTALKTGGHFPDLNLDNLGSMVTMSSDGEAVEIDLKCGFVKKQLAGNDCDRSVRMETMSPLSDEQLSNADGASDGDMEEVYKLKDSNFKAGQRVQSCQPARLEGIASDEVDRQMDDTSVEGGNVRNEYDVIEDVDENEAIDAFLHRFTALKQGGHFPDANLDALGPFGRFSPENDEAVEVDVAHGFVRKELEPCLSDETPWWQDAPTRAEPAVAIHDEAISLLGVKRYESFDHVDSKRLRSNEMKPEEDWDFGGVKADGASASIKRPGGTPQSVNKPSGFEISIDTSAYFHELEMKNSNIEDWIVKESMANWGIPFKKNWLTRSARVGRPKPINGVAAAVALTRRSPGTPRRRHCGGPQHWKRSYKQRIRNHSGYFNVDAYSLYEASLVEGPTHPLDFVPWENRDVRQRFLQEQSLSFSRNWFGKLVRVRGNDRNREPVCHPKSMEMPHENYPHPGEWTEEWYTTWKRPRDHDVTSSEASSHSSDSEFDESDGSTVDGDDDSTQQSDTKSHGSQDKYTKCSSHDGTDDSSWEDVPECGNLRTVKLRIGEHISRIHPEYTSSLRRSRWRKKYFPRGTFPY